MNNRERHLAALLFEKSDRIPFMPGGPRESTLKAWHQQGLPENVNWLSYLAEQIGVKLDRGSPAQGIGVNFNMIPEFERKIVEKKADSLVVQDWKGNICEISDDYDPTYLGGTGGKCDFVTRRWIKCPVENRDDWEKMKIRYDPNDPARFPPDIQERTARWKNRDYILQVGFSGVFWQLREWMGFEGICMAFIEQPDLVRDMIAFWDNFVCTLLEKIFELCVPDVIHVSEDMAYKEKAMISPEMTREFILPTWSHWGDIVRGSGCPIYDMDSDGFIGELIPLWIESGFNVNDPVEVAAGNNLPAFRRQYGRQMAYVGGVDKRAMARGGSVIRAEIDRLQPVIKSGGYIPSCDHGIPADVSWPNMVDYSRLLAQATGWL